MKKIETTDYKQICELKGHKGQVMCICKLNLGYMASGDGDLEEKTNHSIYIWKPKEKGFVLEQLLKEAHNSDVNCIILLRDGRMASSSRDRTIKIWGINKYKIKTNNKIEYVLQQTLNEYIKFVYLIQSLLSLYRVRLSYLAFYFLNLHFLFLKHHFLFYNSDSIFYIF